MASSRVSCYPNAGLPDEEGAYGETPDSLAASLERFVKNGWLNVIDTMRGFVLTAIDAIKTHVVARIAELVASALARFYELRDQAVATFGELKTRAIEKLNELKN